MSMIYKGEIVNTELSENAMGGTEMMRQRIIDNVDAELLKNVAIHLSRPRKVPSDVKNIMYCHDLAEDPENKVLEGQRWKQFDKFVFVSQWQRDQYIVRYGIPYSMCSVIPNAIERNYDLVDKPTDKIRFIYHTTPHRGLELLYPVFDELSKNYSNIHLDVYSSFAIYGWPVRDDPYVKLFTDIHNHPNMTYHGSVPNEQILEALTKAHVFLYPNIWRETSCIALIEAIKSGVLCIHPNNGALTETAAGASITYNYTEDLTKHANIAYNVATNVLKVHETDPEFFNKYGKSDRFNLAQNGIPTFTNAWNSVLAGING